MNMTRFCIPVLLLFFSVPLHAEVHISSQHHQRNSPRGMCVWSAIETLARHHEIKPLIGIFYYYDSWRDSQGKPWTLGFQTDSVQKQLEYSEVKGWCVNNADESWVWWAIKKDYGCVIGLKNYPYEGELHAVLLTEINDREVHFIDSNHPGKLWTASLEWFRSHWSGFFICLEKVK